MLIVFKDVEAQNTVEKPNMNSIEATQPSHAHSGRGGAGNFKPTSISSPANALNDLSTSVKQPEVLGGRRIGRGGVGNFVSSDAVRRDSEVERQHHDAQAKAFAQTVEDVEKGLKQPERAYLGSRKSGDP